MESFLGKIFRRNKTPEEHLAEIHELTVLAARRCAYDLRHAANGCRRIEEAEMYHERARMWLNIFAPTDGTKQYRHRLHHAIREAESTIENYRKWFKEQGIEDPFPDEIPF